MYSVIKFLSVALIIVLSGTLYATRWEVPEQIENIQPAVDTANAGDTVTVWGEGSPPFTYQPITVNKNIVVINRSFEIGHIPQNYESSYTHVVIDAGDSMTGVTFTSGLNRNAILHGFTITNGLGRDSGGGIYIKGSHPLILHNRITHCKAVRGAGIFAIPGANHPLSIKYCNVDTNDASLCGGGIWINSGLSNDSLVGNIIENNRASDDYDTEGWGGGIYISSATGELVLYGNIIKNNKAGLEGGGIRSGGGYKARRNIIMNNNNGYGVFVSITISPNWGRINFDHDAGYNVIHGNAGYDFYLDLLDDQPPDTIRVFAEGNYWGSLDTDTIKSHNVFTRPWLKVDWSPIAASDKDTSITYDTKCSTGVLVTGDLTVNSNKILTVVKGKTFMFETTADTNTGVDSEHCELIIKGKLKAIGTSSDSISFISYALSPEKGDWYGIRTKSNSVDSFDYCKIKHAYSGIRSESSNVSVVHSRIEQNQNDGIHFIRLQNAKIRNCAINYNGVYGIYSYESSQEIRNCNLTDNVSYGIYLNATDSAKVYNNQINGWITPAVATLHGIYLKTGSNMKIDTNTVRTYGQSGIYVDGSTETELHKNSIIDNEYYGIYCTGQATPYVRWCTIDSSTTAQVYCDGNSYPDLGTEQDSGYNSILLKCTYYVYNGNESGDPISAVLNWWGTDNPDPDKFYGQVTYEPWLPSQPRDGGQSANIINPTPPFALYSPKPNPARSSIRIAYSLPSKCKSELVICDVSGRIVTKRTEEKEPGQYEYLWQGKDQRGKVVPNGIYIVRLKARNNLKTQKMVLAR